MIKVGTEVMLKPTVKFHTCPEGRENYQTAKVTALLENGGLYLSRDLHGCRYWNEEDVDATDKKFVLLEGFAVRNRFFTINDPNEPFEEKRKLKNGDVVYSVLGFADTVKEAQIKLYGREIK